MTATYLQVLEWLFDEKPYITEGIMPYQAGCPDPINS